MEVTYWIDRSFWGRGFTSRALELLLHEVSVRPIRTRVASDNIGSLRVLQKVGFSPLARRSRTLPPGVRQLKKPSSSTPGIHAKGAPHRPVGVKLSNE